MKSSLEPLASGAQDELVDVPSSVAANDGGVSEVSALEKADVGVGKAAVALGIRHLEMLEWQR